MAHFITDFFEVSTNLVKTLIKVDLIFFVFLRKDISVHMRIRSLAVLVFALFLSSIQIRALEGRTNVFSNYKCANGAKLRDLFFSPKFEN